MPFYPGDPQPVIQPAAEYDSGGWRVTSLHIGTHTGTHIDAPSHFIKEGRAIDQLPLETFVLPGICVEALGLEPDQPIEEALLADTLAAIPAGGAVLFHTGWDQFWGQERYFRHPYLAETAARRLRAAGARLVGIDALNVDSTARGTTHAHEILLGSQVLIVENLRGLDQLAAGEAYMISVLPIRLVGLDGSPVRAIAWQ